MHQQIKECVKKPWDTIVCPICRATSDRKSMKLLPGVERLTRAMYPNSVKSRQKEVDEETERIVQEVFAKYAGKKSDCVLS